MLLKDYVTLGNLLSGFLSVVMLIRGDFDWAVYLIYIGFLFDVLDGPVARLMGQYNEFGGAFDSVCDFVTYSIAPSFIIYYAFAEHLHFPWMVAAAIGAVPITFGTIRHALYASQRMSYPGYFLGLPRPALPIFVLALLQSSLFHNTLPSPWKEITWGFVVLVIVGLGVIQVTRIPFVSHHDRRFMGLPKFGYVWFLWGSIVMVPFVIYFDAVYMLFDKLLADLFLYVFLGWTQVPRTDLRRIKHYLATGEVIPPLIHPDSGWRTQNLAPYLHPQLDPPPGADGGPVTAES